MTMKMRTTTPITTVVAYMSVVIVLSLTLLAPHTKGVAAASASGAVARRSSFTAVENYQRLACCSGYRNSPVWQMLVAIVM
jgi:hypothetical protein